MIITDHLVEIAARAIEPHAFRTFDKGRPGDWTGAKAFDKAAAKVLQARIRARAALSAVAPEIVETCAKVAENPGFIQARDTEWDEGVNFAKEYIAKAIRNA